MFDRLRSRAIILMYHRIASIEHDPWSLCVSAQHFAEHLDVLRKYRTARLDQLQTGRWAMGRGLSIAITFDDGYADNFYTALPLLKRYGTPATFFIATGYIDSPEEFWWDELERIVYAQSVPADGSRDELHLSLYRTLQPLSHEARQDRLKQMRREASQASVARPSHRILTSGELAALAAQELVEIGSHTVTHPLLSALPPKEQLAELALSKQHLEAVLGREISSVSYPYGGTGHYSPSTVRAASQCGFKRACTTNPRCVRASDSPLEWGRIQVPSVNGERFEKFLETCGGN